MISPRPVVGDFGQVRRDSVCIHFENGTEQGILAAWHASGGINYSRQRPTGI